MNGSLAELEREIPKESNSYTTIILLDGSDAI